MSYLCADHYDAMQQKSEQVLSEYSVRWLSLSRQYTENNQCRQALAFAGCAYDVVGVRLERFPQGDWTLPVMICLSGINLAQHLRRIARHDEAEGILDLSCGRLSRCPQKDNPPWRNSLKVLTQENLWAPYLRFHLGDPEPKTACRQDIRTADLRSAVVTSGMQ